jgi:unsaturated rhamnogalacturonyl hydrolase
MTMTVTSAVLFAGSVLLLAAPCVAAAQQSINLRQMTQLVMARWPSARALHSSKGLGVLLDGMNAAWYDTADGDDYQYIKQSIDPWIAHDGSLQISEKNGKLRQQDSLGGPILLLYRVTGEKRYYQAASRIRDALLASTSASGGKSPRGPKFGFRGDLPRIQSVSANEPFLAEYASIFRQPQDFEQITAQFAGVDVRVRNSMSADIRARYMKALVEALQYYPSDSTGRAVLLKILSHTAAEAVRMQGRHSGLSTLHPGHAEAEPYSGLSASLFAYALAKGVRLGYLPVRYRASAMQAWQAAQNKGSSQDDAPTSGASVDEGRMVAGARLLAACEMQLVPFAAKGAHQTVLVDAWFNSQERSNAAGERELFHYKWTDYRSSGFSLFGHMFRSFGISTRRLAAAPTVSNLSGAQYYVIASPDNPAKNPQPHYVTAGDAKQVEEWVRRGGVLVLMENDPANADIPHLDILADAFGLHFNNRLTHAATEYDYAMGRIDVSGGGPLFHQAHTLYMKDTCSLQLSKGATSLLTYKGDIFMAAARYGRGTVYAVTDPWLYNEYTDGRKLPPHYDNFAAGMELVRWLLQQHAPAVFQF